MCDSALSQFSIFRRDYLTIEQEQTCFLFGIPVIFLERSIFLPRRILLLSNIFSKQRLSQSDLNGYNTPLLGFYFLCTGNNADIELHRIAYFRFILYNELFIDQLDVFSIPI